MISDILEAERSTIGNKDICQGCLCRYAKKQLFKQQL